MTYSSSHREGYKNIQSTPIAFEGLASEHYDTIPISIDVASRDVGNPDGSTHLRPYLAMGYDTSSGRYKPFNSALHGHATVVVLAEEVRDVDQVSTFVNSFAFIRATFKKNAVIEPTAVTWSSVQRITIRDNVTV